MGKEIIINARKDQTRIAIVEDGELVEMYFEDPDNERTLGDVYLGRVRRIMPSIQAAFIDIGQASDAFLHFSDIADNVGDMVRLLEMDQPDVGKVELTAPGRHRRPRDPSGTQVSMSNEEDDAEEDPKRSRKGGKRQNGSNGNGGKAEGFRPENLKKDQAILVKIVKEPISSKGSRVSTDISLAGRFLVLVPLADYVAVSKKIVSHKERRRLRALAKSLLPKGFGLIVRTVAEDKNAKALDTDLRLLVEKWRRIEKRIGEVKNPPAVLHQDVSMVSSIVRDLFSDDYDRILIDDQRVFRNVKGYIQAVAPQMAPAVKHHTDRQPIFQAAKIDKTVRQAFEPRVELQSGGYVIIEHTEAMHVVDVNSGRAGRGLSQEQNSLKVNIEAARTVAQQLRLRDLGGIIVVDFIDLRDDKNRKKVFDELKKHFRKDRAVTKVLPMSDFGVMQITRQRLRPSITTIKAAAEAEPVSTDGKADRGATESVKHLTPEEWRDKLERWVKRYHEKGRTKPLVLRVHPFARTVLGRGVARATLRWLWKYRLRIRVETDPDENPMSFRFFDPESGDELTGRRKRGRKRGGRRDAKGDETPQTKARSGDRSGKGERTSQRKKRDGRDRQTERGRSKKKSEQTAAAPADGRDNSGTQSGDGSGSSDQRRKKSRRGRRGSGRSKRRQQDTGSQQQDSGKKQESGQRKQQSGRQEQQSGRQKPSDKQDAGQQPDPGQRKDVRRKQDGGRKQDAHKQQDADPIRTTFSSSHSPRPEPSASQNGKPTTGAPTSPDRTQ